MENKIASNQFIILDRVSDNSSKGFNNLNFNKSDPILLEIFNNLFMNIAEQMGTVLQQTASSVNIKERVDFSSLSFRKEVNLLLMHHICQFIWDQCTICSKYY